MTNVVQFPTADIRDWVLLERTMRDQLSKAGAPTAAHDRLIQQMKAFYEVLNVQISTDVPISVDLAISDATAASLREAIGRQVSAAIGERLHELTSKLFIERFHREIEICGELGLL